MSYLVVARRWRPQRFDDIVGQAHITRVLQNAIRSNRIAHAYLFTGVRGVGKTTAARILAKALNCETGPTTVPCDRCSQCAEIMGGSSLDVHEIDGASNRGIDEIRQLIENSRYQPARSRFKIYIIDEVHQITRDAFNALLKTLEEPPPFVKFILATTEPHRLPETILSRCQRFDFRRIPVLEICQRLREIADRERLSITDGALVLLAREAEGSMRDAQSLLEQALSYAAPGSEEPEAGGPIDEDLLQDLLGIAERKTLYDLSASVLAGDAARCVELVAELTERGRDLARFSRDLVEHFRNLLVARLVRERTGQGAASAPKPASAGRLLDLPDREIEDLHRQAAELSVEALMDYFAFMAEADEEVARSAYPRFALEAAVVRLATLPKTIPVVEVLSRLEALEGKLGRERASGPRPAAEVQRRLSAPEKPSSSEAKGEEEPAAVWRKFVSFVAKERRFLGSYLERVVPMEVSAGRLRIGVEDRHHLDYLEDPENLGLLKTLARRFFDGEVAVTVAVAASAGGEAGAAAENSSPASGAGHAGRVEDVLRIFGGSIKEIKREDS